MRETSRATRFATSRGLSLLGGWQLVVDGDIVALGGREQRRCRPENPSITYAATPSLFPTFWNASSARSRCGLVWPAEIWTRIRALPFGTTG